MSRFGVITRNGIVRSFIEGSQANLYDPDAQAFFTAASITDTTQKNAVNTLVLSLKSANIWTKMRALYPVVGGVASSHAVNLKTPGTYNLTFATGWTHSSTGMTPNGATHADTALNANVLNINSAHISYYSRTNRATNSNSCMGSWWVGGLSIIYARYLDSLYTTVNQSGASYAIQSVTNSVGLLTGSRTGASLQNGYKNTASVSNTGASNAPGAYSYKIGATVQSNGTTWSYDNLQCAFASIGDGLTDADVSNLYTAVQTYQTTLGRQV